ncbi:MAG: hypothetical protein ABIH85_00935 [Candidatus Omnitrophota bacterium]
MMNKYFAAIDTKSDEISAVASRWRDPGSCVLEGFCRVRCKGFKKGMVADAAEAANSIATVLDKLMRKTGKNIQNVYATISSESVNVMPSSGVVLLSKYGREVTETDIKRCIEVGSTIKIGLDKEPLHKIVKDFYIDDEKGIRNPLNLEGVKLGVDINIVTINSSVLRNMAKCIAQAGFVPAGFVFSGLAVGYRILSDEDNFKTVVFLNICKSVTEVMVFSRGILSESIVVSMGANDFYSQTNEFEKCKVESFFIAITKLKEWKKNNKVIILGEGSFMDDLLDFAEKFFKLPVFPGICHVRPFEELPPERACYAGSLGVLNHIEKENIWRHGNTGFIKASINNMLRFMDHYF